MGGAEIDFVLVRGERRIGVEVKAGALRRPSRSVRSFVDAYAPEEFLLVGGTDESESEERLGATRLRRMPVQRVAASVREIVDR